MTTAPEATEANAAMPTDDRPDGGAPATGTTPAGPVTSGSPPPGGPGGRSGARFLHRVLPPALEVLALSAFVVARPVFASFGRSPETFVARGADWTDVVAWALVLLLGPVVAVMVGETLVGLVAGERLRRVAHGAALTVLLALAVWQIAGQFGDWERRVGVPVSLAAGVALVVAWARWASVGTFLRYAALGAPVFLVQLLVLSPSSSIVFGGRHAFPADAAAAVGDDAPPVVLVVLDGLPTGLLLDGEGHIDEDLYPNLAALAGDGTWYRNHTTVAQVTLEAVPAILSGTQPAPDQPPALAGNYPRNIFTLLADSYEVHGAETITGLCPVQLCPEPAGSPLVGLVRDAGRIWRDQMADTAVDPELVPAAFAGRLDRAEDWLAGQDFDQSGGPTLHVVHHLLPHPGWEYLPDGSRYRAASVRPSGLFFDTWGEWAVEVARQRHVLQAQAVDRQLGDLLDRLRDDGVYDDALVVVTADHGYAFTPDSPWRALDEDNYDQIMWTPLIVKAPGQREGAVDDSNVNSLDVLPTIAAELGVEIPWEVDGEPAGTADRDPADKWIVDWEHARIHPEGDGEVVRVDGEEGFARVLASDPVPGTGPLAVWQRTDHGALVGAEVDDLDVGAAADATLEVRDLDWWDDVDADRPPLEVVGYTPLPAGETVAITVDGVVAATVPVSPTSYGVGILGALLWPGALDEGRNHVEAYLVEGPAEAPVLRPLEVRARSDG